MALVDGSVCAESIDGSYAQILNRSETAQGERDSDIWYGRSSQPAKPGQRADSGSWEEDAQEDPESSHQPSKPGEVEDDWDALPTFAQPRGAQLPPADPRQSVRAGEALQGRQ
eukprot:scaffold455440_cov17-Prasinocladus_malaysianus.AAC.1